jgi:N6-L-threonylcarbamoyladenine synthase
LTAELFLGIETSCDETSVALYQAGKGIIGSKISTQIELHAKFGGVVPEVASRNHMLKIKPLFDELLKDTNIKLKDIDVIGVTVSPGLIGALFVGVAFAKGLSAALNIPIVPVNHLAGHLLSVELENDIKPPYLGLIISGGHTHIYNIDEKYNFTLFSKTIDDAVGEAFDKVAKMLGFAYPGGPFIEKEALKGDENSISFPIPMKNKDDFSFSGLKTAVLNIINKNEYSKADISASFQKTAVDSLILKTFKAAKKNKLKQIVIAGGVACNSYLRNRFLSAANKENIRVYFPSPKLCTDNADMIAYTAYKLYDRNVFLPLDGTAYGTDPYIDRY